MWRNCALFSYNVYSCVYFDYHNKHQLVPNSINRTVSVVDKYGFLCAVATQYLLTIWIDFSLQTSTVLRNHWDSKLLMDLQGKLNYQPQII